MLADTLFRVQRSDGLQLLQERGTRGATELTSWRLRLPAGGAQTYSVPTEETVVILQEGRGRFEAGSRQWDVGRAGVFIERATALYLPPGELLSVHADTALEAVLVSTPAPPGGEVAIVRARMSSPQKRGLILCARVHNLFVPCTVHG